MLPRDTHIARLCSGMLILALAAGALPGRAIGPSAALAQSTTTIAFRNIPLEGSSDDTNALATGDIDGDGDLDLVTGDEAVAGTRPAARARLYLNNGSATPFGGVAGIGVEGTTESVRALALGDLDGDGWLDLVVGAAGVERIYLNQRVGPYFVGPGLALPGSSSETASLAVGDVDGDGRLDLITGNKDADLLYLNAGGAEPFRGVAPAPIPGGDQETAAVELGYVNGDERLDLIIAVNGSLLAYINNGSKAPFAQGGTSFGSLGSSQGDIVLGDIDLDGDQDLAVVGQTTPQRVYWNTGQPGWFDAGITFASQPTVEGVDLGDVDRDGDLDLVMTTSPYRSADPGEEFLFLNQYSNGTLPPHSSNPFSQPIAITFARDYSSAILFGDADGDSDLDLVSANNGSEQVYFNYSTSSFFAHAAYGAATPSALALIEPEATANDPSGEQVTALPETVSSASLNVTAAGDIDGDGDLDVIAGTSNSNIALYRNNRLPGGPAGQPAFSQLQTVAQLGITSEINVAAFGDLEGDGKLDLVVGTEASDLVFLNNGTSDPFAGVAGRPLAGSGSRTSGLALGDVDGDGDLDLVAGNTGRSLVYLNNGSPDPLAGVEPAQLPGVDMTTLAVALGDVDGDGDLDLVTGNDGSELLFLNGGDAVPFRQWGLILPRSESTTYSLALGDINGDGGLDLVTGNEGPELLYLSDSNAMPFSGPIITLGDGERTTGALLADLDGDHDLDLAFAHIQVIELYLNDGGTQPFATSIRFRGEANPGYSDTLAAGDIDLDGDVDLFGSLARWRNLTFDRPALANNPPTVSLVRPGARGGAPATISFTLRDPESDLANVRAFYSPDGGGSWSPAAGPTTGETTNLATSPGGTAHTLTWDTSGLYGWTDQALLRVEARPAGSGQNAPAGSYQRPYTAGTSAPFRLRGWASQIRHQDGGPAYGALLYRLPGGKTRDATPLASRQTGAPLASNWRGEINSPDPLRAGDTLVALEPISSTAKYTLYHTSARPVRDGLEGLRVQGPGSQALTVTPEHPLLVLSLTVSLEWDAGNDASFLQDLRQGVGRASEILYDWSDGQVAIGAVTISHGRASWDSADIQVYASNRLRPNAAQGGITPSTRSETVTVDGRTSTLVYEPGQIRIGAAWSRYGDPGVNYGEDWSRALAHELGHYALYLDETYLGFDGGRPVSVTSCPSPMSDPYRPGYSELRTAAGWLPGCAKTLAHRSTGRPEWGTVTTFYPGLRPSDLLGEREGAAPPTAITRVYIPMVIRPGVPSSTGTPPGVIAPTSDGPSVLPLGLTTFHEVAPATRAEALPAALFDLATATGTGYEPGAGARAILLPAAGDRIVDLGAPMVDRVLVRGARAGDTLCVLDPAGGMGGCEAVREADYGLTLYPTGAWRPQVQVRPGSEGRTLQVSATGLGDLGDAEIKARLFATDLPVTSTAVPATPITLAPQGAGYTGTFAAAEPVTEGYVLIWAEGRRDRGLMTLVDFSVGGSPAPKKKTKARNKKRAPGVSADGQLTVFAEGLDFADGQFFTIQSLPVLPRAPEWATPLGQGYRLDASGAGVLGPRLAVSIGYAEGDVPIGQEQGLRVYFLPDGGTWRELPSAADLEQNEVVAQAADSPGVYALMASVRLSLPTQGWNLVYAYPGASQALPAALSAFADKYSAVYGYDEGGGDDPWRLYGPGAPAYVSDLHELVSGESYWIHTTAALDAPIKGPGEDTAALSGSGVLAPPPATYFGGLPAGVSPTGLRVEGRVGESLCGTGRVDVGAGGFVVHVKAIGPDELEGCGVPGAEVEITLLRGDTAVGVYTGPWDNEALHAVLLDPR